MARWTISPIPVFVAGNRGTARATSRALEMPPHGLRWLWLVLFGAACLAVFSLISNSKQPWYRQPRALLLSSNPIAVITSGSGGSTVANFLSGSSTSDAAIVSQPAAKQGHSNNTGTWPVGSMPIVQCEPLGIALVVVVKHSTVLKDHLMRWMAVVNRYVYAAQHGYTVYASVGELHQRPASWHKVLLVQVAFQHSCPEFVWALDSDAFIMNMTLSLESVLYSVLQKPPGQRPDVMIAKDCNDINGGSVIFRHSAWTHQHLSDAWALPQVKNSGRWWEQAAYIYLLNNSSSVGGHYHYLPQRSLNAYPPGHFPECQPLDGGNASYQEGDLAVHFVHTSKDKELSLDADWLNTIPIYIQSRNTQGRSARVFGVWPWPAAGQRTLPRGQQVVDVLMQSRINIAERLSDRFLVVPEPAAANLGWPVRMPKLILSAVSAAIAQRGTAT